MKNILWAQNSDSTKVSIFNIDGVISHYSSTKEQDEAYSFLLKEANKLKQVNKNDYRFRISKENIYIDGYFNEFDGAGRQITFMFLHQGKSISEAINTLKKYAQQINRSLSPTLEKEIAEHVKNNKEKRKKYKIIGSVFIIITILSIFLLIFKNQ